MVDSRGARISPAQTRRKFRTLQSMSWADRALVTEAAVMLVAARATLAILPFRWFEPWLSLNRAEDASNTTLVARVRRAVNIASRNLPLKVACLPQAMAAKVMLARRGTRSSLWIGAARADDGEMILHAWLEAGGTIVTGEAGQAGVTPVARFG